MLDFVNKAVEKIFGKKSDKDIAEVMPQVKETLAEYEKLASLSNDQLRAKTAEFKQRINEAIKEEQDEIVKLKAQVDDNPDMDAHEKERIYEEVDKLETKEKEKIEDLLNDILPEAFAVVKETARRFKENEFLDVTATEMDKDLSVNHSNVEILGSSAKYYNKWIAGGAEITWDMVHYDVQLIGGVVLHEGKIAEMATGEGKTLVATLPVYLNALAGRGVHVVTVNDYLAKRDSEWMGPLYQFHGLSVDCIDKHRPNSEERRQAYLADITFGTNNEFGFDYLRDNMARSPQDLVQRPHNYAIVDEVDSVLIDDARTPLIISGPIPKGDQHEFIPLKPKIEKLMAAQRSYLTPTLAEAKKLIAEGNEKDGGVALLRCYRGLPKNKALIKYLSEPGVKQILQKTENYYLQDQAKEMHKIDEELFFVIEEKQNSVDLTEKGIDLITTNADDPNFFILPDVGSAMADIEKMNAPDREKAEKKDELLRDFGIKSERVHTINQLLKAFALFEKDVEYVVMDNKVMIVDEQTGRIMEGRRYSDGLHQAIEAKENLKIEDATQTYATVTLQNYFRMYNKLAGMTGTAETEAGEFWDIYKLDVVVIPTNRPIARDDSEDMVFKTNREKYKAVIDEIVKLTKEGRPVLVGTTSVEISELLGRMLKMKNINHNILNAKLHQREAEVVAMAGKAGAVTIATNMAGRGTDIKLGPGVKDAGGLAIIGTERHESRRVDRQLRGRAGRQGDPGSSQFFVSLEDNLMRLFGSERISKVMDRMGHQEGDVIQHSMITKSIERAQKKVEENNFGIRKRLLEYDDVMNNQREVIYKRRRHALYGERLALDISNMIYDTVEFIVQTSLEAKDYESYKLDMIRNFSVEANISEDEFLNLSPNELTEKTFAYIDQKYREKKEAIAERALPVIKQVFENQGHQFENMVVPFTDGNKTLNVVAHLQKSYDSNGKELTKAFEKNIVLAIIDDLWKDHLREMDELKTSVQNATYEQKDPLLIYKFESFELFKKLLDKVSQSVIPFLFKAQLPSQDPANVREAKSQPRTDMSKVTANKPELAGASAGGGRPQGPPNMPPEPQKVQPVRVEQKVGRNDPCPCGSGKKYKHCHGS